MSILVDKIIAYEFIKCNIERKSGYAVTRAKLRQNKQLQFSLQCCIITILR